MARKAQIQSATYFLDGQPLPYRLVRSRTRVKTITLEYRAGRGISLAVPSDMNDGEVTRFLQAREEWLRQRKSDMENAPPPRNWDNGETIPFRGQEVAVVVNKKPDLLHADGTLVQRSMDCGTLDITVPEGLTRDERDCRVDQAIEDWYISEAKQYLPARLREWSELTGLHADKVRISKARSRWGSCSGQRNIRLTWRLIKLPDRLSDYVIVHELAHLRESHHQKPFWDLVESIMPDARQRRKELRSTSRKSAD